MSRQRKKREALQQRAEKNEISQLNLTTSPTELAQALSERQNQD